MRWALYVTLAPSWFDPGEITGGFLTPFWVLYAMHDALVKPMPGNLMAPSLAESWTVSADQRVYDFKLREGLKFHNGDPFTADDVKFSFQRSKVGKVLKDRVRDVEIVSPSRVRFHLHEPFPDFMTYYGTLATGAGWIVPRKYVEKVGDEGFKKQPIGLGPYKFVSYTPGIELVVEAFEGHWRKVPSVKRMVFKTIPDPTTRAAALKNGEVDLAYMLDTPTALELKRDPSFRLGYSGAIGVHYLEFFDQWDPKSPWHDRRVRLAANHAIDRKGLSEAETLGASRPTGSMAPRNVRVHAGAAALRLRSAEGEAAARGGGLSERVRRRRLLSLPALLVGGRDDRHLLRRGRHQDEGAHDGARGLPDGVGGQEAERRLLVHAGELRQRGDAHRGRGDERGHVRARHGSGRRRALQAAGARDGSPQARSHAPSDPADALRPRAIRPALRVHLGERDWPARRRAGADADRSVSVGGAAGGRTAEGEVTFKPDDAKYLNNHRGHLMFLKPEERPYVTADLIRTTSFTATEPMLTERVEALRDAGYTQFTVQIVPGQEQAIEDWARIKRAFG